MLFSYRIDFGVAAFGLLSPSTLSNEPNLLNNETPPFPLSPHSLLPEELEGFDLNISYHNTHAMFYFIHSSLTTLNATRLNPHLQKAYRLQA